jgi:hypothetical protein
LDFDDTTLPVYHGGVSLSATEAGRCLDCSMRSDRASDRRAEELATDRAIDYLTLADATLYPIQTWKGPRAQADERRA